MNAACEQYLNYLTHERRLATLTLKHYRRDLVLLEELVANDSKTKPAPRVGALPTTLATLSQMDIRRYAAMLHARGLGPKSIARVLSGWRGFYTFLRHQSGAANPVDGVRAPKAEKRLPETLSPDEAVRLVSFDVDTAESIRDRAMFELLYSSGFRVSELAGLNLDSIDYATQEARVTGKGNKTRIVPVGKPAIEAVKQWLELRETMKVNVDINTDKHTDRHTDKNAGAALFLSKQGKRISVRVIQNQIKIRASQQGISVDVHPHMLRHSFASHVLQSSGDLRAVQEMLGHASIASTQVYTHLDFQHLAKIYDAAHPRAKKKT